MDIHNCAWFQDQPPNINYNIQTLAPTKKEGKNNKGLTLICKKNERKDTEKRD